MTTMPAPLLSPRRDKSIPTQPSKRPTLQVIPGSRSASRRVMIVCITAFSLALALALGLNIALAQGAYELKATQHDAALLAEHQQVRSEQLAQFSAPGALCQSARKLGMVPSDVIQYLRLSDGAILGDRTAKSAPVAATGNGLCLQAQQSKTSTG